jgi:hypothetical protein
MTAGHYRVLMKFPPGLGDADSIVNLDEDIGRTVGNTHQVTAAS